MTTIKVNIDSTDHYLELYENDPINLMLQYSDIEKIQSAVGSFSQTFRIPATEVNFAAFGDFTNSNNIGFNAKRKSSAIIMKDTLPLIYGVIQLKQTYIIDGKHSEYEIVFFGEAVNLARTLGDKKLVDLDLSAYDHLVSYSNVALSWLGALFSGQVRYGLIDKKNYSQIGSGVAITEANPIYAGDFTPCLRLEQVVKAIFEDNGLLYESTFIDGLDNYYIPFYRGESGISAGGSLQDSTIRVGLVTDQSSAYTEGLNTYLLTSLSESAPFYDNGGNFASNQYTAPYNTNYNISYLINLEHTTSTYGGAFYARVILRDVTDGVNVYASPYQIVVLGTQIIFNDSPTIELTASHVYQIGIQIIDGSGGTFTIKGNNTFGTSGSSWAVDSLEGYGNYGQTCDLASNAPDIKQIDFLTSLQKMFNLIFIADPLIDNKFNILTFEDFASGGAIKDWSSYLDESKDIIIKPTTDIQSKNYEWTYSKEGDYLNKVYEENAQRIYGRYLIEDGENDFSTGDLKVQPQFGAFPLMPIGGTNILVHKSVDDKGEIIDDPLCKVVYWGGLIDSTSYHVYNDGTSSAQLLTQYPYIGHYSTPNPAADDIDLNFGGEIPAHPIEANPYDNLFNTYWRNYVNQLYSVEARIMEAQFWLTTREIHDFDFSDQIWIKDSYWRVLKIQYSATEKALSKVTLIKILDDVRACDEIPYQSNTNGVITFQNADGTTTTTPSQECCERFGYVYIGTTCYQPGYQPQGTPINSPYDASTPALQGSNPEGNVFANGSNVVAPSGSSGVTIGDDITLADSARNTIVHGDTIEVSGIRNIFAGGSNTNAFVEGSHRGGGWWYPDFRSGSLGAAQSGEVIFIFEGTFDSGHTRELFIEGKLNNRLSIPNNTGMSVRFEMQLITISAATGRPNIVHNAIFLECFKKSNNVATGFYGAHANAAIHEVGGMGNNKIHMDIDVTTDTTQHRIQMHNQSFSNRETTRIVCKMSYVMGSL